MNKVVEKWDEILQIVKTEHDLSDVSFKTWLKPLTVYQVEGNIVTIIVPSEQVGLNYISKKYKLPLQVTISEVTGMENCEINFILPEDVPKKEAAAPKVQSQDTRCEEAHLNPKYTFDTFVVGSNNKFAQAAALAVAESPGDAYNPLFIYGNSGLGKTHLLNAICYEIRLSNPNSDILYVRGEDFTNELITSIAEKKMIDFHNKYRKVDVLLVDDVQFISGKIQTQEEFFHTFENLSQAGKQIVLTSDRPPKEILTLEDRLRTRFEWGLLADIQPPDLETRIAIVKRKAQLLNIGLPDDVTEYIAQKLKTNIRQLEGAVKRMKAYHSIEGHPPTILLAQRAIKDILSDSQPVPVTVEKIIQEVARTYGITEEDIRSNKRDSTTSKARQAAMYIVREVTGLPMKAIGDEFGGRDHSTVLYTLTKIEKEMEKNPSLKATISDTIKNIQDQ